MKIYWITLHTSDLVRSKEFYTDYLGMSVEREFSPAQGTDIIFLTSENGMQIELIGQTEKSAAPDFRISALCSISIGISSADYEKLLSEARVRNILTAEPAVLGGQMECFFVSDPDGTGIQIIRENSRKQ